MHVELRYSALARHTGSFLNEPPIIPPTTSDGDDDLPTSLPPATVLLGSLAGQVLGNYTLVREIAAGGMGVVYEAIQKSPRRTVAVKLLRAGLSGDAARTRFMREAQLLARFQHPHIAQVFEAGMTQSATGPLPWFAMEYIAGAKDIVSYARENQLDIEARIELILQAASALQHGHERGIIHRDIKPSNLLVDSAGRVKLIDFGVAHAADTDALSTLAQTAGDQLIGTLQYMSPEQCGGDAHAVDARSDIYSLGLVMYEMLTDQLPYVVSGNSIVAAARLLTQDFDRFAKDWVGLVELPEPNLDLPTRCGEAWA